MASNYNKFKYLIIIQILCFLQNTTAKNDKLPLIINTWAFLDATEKAWDVLYNKNGDVLDAVVTGCSTCESLQCDGTVGYGGSPDENGETTLDALIMDGDNLNVGAVGGLRRIKHASSVARKVLENTKHSFLVGDFATQFAVKMGFKEETLETNKSVNIWNNWKEQNCQPNFWTNVRPDSKQSCGPYHPINPNLSENDINYFNSMNHDTIGLIAIDEKGRIAAGTSTNGANHKIPGRVGDSPIPGAGAYVDSEVGGAAATGDGDIMLRFLPSYQAVESMRHGLSPSEAARIAIERIVRKYPSFFGGIIVANKNGEYAAACHGMRSFPFSVYNLILGKVTLQHVSCKA